MLGRVGARGAASRQTQKRSARQSGSWGHKWGFGGGDWLSDGDDADRCSPSTLNPESYYPRHGP